MAGPENRLLATTIEPWLLQRGEGEPDGALTDGTPELGAGLPPDRLGPGVLAIHGPSGTGKTHLARGLVRHWQEQLGRAAAEYFTAADFRHALIDAIKQDQAAEFRRRVRQCHLLAIDDIDRLASDDYVQQELRYTIDHRVEAGHLTLVTSARAVGGLQNLAVAVRSRLSAGLVVAAAPPDVAARERLVHMTAALLGQPLSPAAAHRLASAVVGTANELFGAVVELRTGGLTRGPTRGESDLAAVERYLAARRARRPSMQTILRVVARYYRVPQKVLKSSSRRQSAVAARAMAAFLARELRGLTFDQIGRALGRRDHTTVMHSYRKIQRQLANDVVTRDALSDLRALLQS